MRKMIALAAREFKSYFHIPMALVVLPAFLGLVGFYFFSAVTNFQLIVVPRPGLVSVSGVNVHESLLIPFFNSTFYVFMLVVPVVTMRLVAEEKRVASWELLLTYPVKSWEILLGKYLGALTFVYLLVFLTLPYPLSLFLFSKPEFATIASTYLGLFLFLAFYVACGLFTSVVTENQIIAALGCFGIYLGFIVIRWLAAVSPPPFEDIFARLLLVDHLGTFARGLVRRSYFVIFPSAAAAVLLATLNQMNKRR